VKRVLLRAAALRSKASDRGARQRKAVAALAMKNRRMV
jgi:hypothetical protein